MAVIFLVVRLVLAAVLAVAGVAKARDRAGTRVSAVGLGVPAGLAPAVALTLPVAELAIAAALVPAATARHAAAAAAVLLAGFTVLLVRNLAAGRTVACSCFGATSSKPIGPRTVARNGLLLAGAGLVIWSPGAAPLPVSTALAAASPATVAVVAMLVVLSVAVAVQGWLLARLLGQQGRLLARIGLLEGAVRGGAANHDHDDHAIRGAPGGLAVGTQAPDFALTSIEGETRTLGDLLSPGRPLVLVFSAPSCAACLVLAPDLARWQREYDSRVSVVVVSAGSRRQAAVKADHAGLDGVLLDGDRAVAEAYGCEGTPAAVLVNADGTIGSPRALGPAPVAALVQRMGEPDRLPVVGQPTRRRPAATGPVAVSVGTVAPVVPLVDRTGEPVLIGGPGREELFVFFDPDCGFCQRLAPDLRAWWAGQPPGATPPTLVATSPPDETDVPAGWTVLFDPDRSAMKAFGASGTPSAVLVDARGRLVSDVARGAGAVLDLARSSTRAGVSR